MRNNSTFIDTQNVNLAIRDQWWKLDWLKLFKHLKKKYLSEKNYIFIWYIPENKKLYDFLEKIWYILIFKNVLILKNWKIKWNVDAELVLQTMIDLNNFDKAIIITWDWDFACLIRHLREIWKLRELIVPNKSKYSWFLKKAWSWLITSLTEKKNKLKK